MRILTTEDLAREDVRGVEAIASAREMHVAVGRGLLRGNALAAALHCDWFIVTPDVRLVLDDPACWSGAVWRAGSEATRLWLTAGGADAEQARAAGLCDAIAADSSNDDITIVRKWIGRRSELALDAAAALIRGRGGDPLERALFAWLFSTGEPQEGLAAFLEKRGAKWIGSNS